MSSLRSCLPILVVNVMLSAWGAAHAAEPAAIATAPAASDAPTSVADQIDNYLRTSPAAALPKDDASGVTSSAEPRQMHSVIDVAVGSNGYRSAFAASELPLGKTSTVTIAVGETQFKGRFDSRFAPDGRQALGLGLALGAGDPESLRCRQAVEEGAADFDPRFGGVRACRPIDLAPPQ